MATQSQVLRSSPQVNWSARVQFVARFVMENWTLLFLALPAVMLTFLLKYVPLFGTVVAFQDFKFDRGFFSPWVGLRNFTVLWSSPKVWQLVANTLMLNVMFIVATTFFAVLIALLLNEVRSRLVRGLYQWLMFLPFFMGWTLVAMVLYGLIDYDIGTLNMLLKQVGLERISVKNDPVAWPWILTVIRVWKGTGAGCIIYLAALMAISPELHEAAALDGANRVQRMRYINLPELVPLIIILTLIAIGHIFFGDFGMIYAVVGDNAMVYATTDVIDTYILRALQQNVNFGLASAVSISQSALGFIMVYGSNWAARRYFGYSLF
jgi:putative aldouronate transport system permease protein